ncbi:hypothetical protein GZ77_14145 [Endozoicomonas montiporae]|uniref:Uncharacterized protein n=2 Tax=Endozoicomonas montiporae TaxID=1027273 RepID=A0A081N4X3_9GAMM|nr:hypothetical protein [Endozoicomonas montiporae]AMO57635.1 hypothetical protein EZMO1_3672 [Endozoicomonas montiporae CL-33]KEQ13496.1 hypothetical protein GZ77_14145 [Endozoicomonas montiporae]
MMTLVEKKTPVLKYFFLIPRSHHSVFLPTHLIWWYVMILLLPLSKKAWFVFCKDFVGPLVDMTIYFTRTFLHACPTFSSDKKNACGKQAFFVARFPAREPLRKRP